MLRRAVLHHAVLLCCSQTLAAVDKNKLMTAAPFDEFKI